MHLLVPSFIQEKFAQGERRGEFYAASLFVDMSCFSTITDELMAHGQHGAEVLANIMKPVFAALVEPVYLHGGLITGFAGDAFTALFPMREDESGIQKAFIAAWQMQQTMASLIHHPTIYGDFYVNAKVGVAIGQARWGIIQARAGHRAAYYFQGSAIDASVQAEQLAEPGDILLSAEIFERMQNQVRASRQGNFFKVQSFEGEIPSPPPPKPPTIDLKTQRLFYPELLESLNVIGEFRQVVNLFIGLTTVRTEDQLDLFMQSVFELQDRYGGLLNRLDFGDKGVNILLFWGAPVAYENDVHTTLKFLLELQSRTSIPINAGVSYQIANAGFIGSPLHEEYTAYGRGVNLAARFMSNAARGEIWVDSQVARKVKDQFELEPVGEMAFKGFEEKQPVFVLIERKDEAEVVDPGPLVGRAIELQKMAEFVSPLWKGQFAGVLVISGEAGIGKSRLAREFQASPLLREKDVRVVTCRTDEVLHTVQLRPVLRDFFQQSIYQSEARNKRSFNRQMDQLIDVTAEVDAVLADDLDRTRSFLAALLNLHWPDSLYEQLDAQGRNENTLIGLTNLLRALSLQQPVILIVEDAHWLDEDARRYLLGLGRMLVYHDHRSYPIAILVTVRMEGLEQNYLEASSGQSIELPRLTVDELKQLAEFHLRGRISPELSELLQERSGGNPFFAEQILRYFQEEELLKTGHEGWQLAKFDDDTLLPNTVRSVLVARLDRLTRDVKELIQTASVIGIDFDLSLLFNMVQEEMGKAQEHVKIAETAWIWSPAEANHYIFRHALVREAAYLMQLRARRSALHARVAEAMESLYTENLNLYYGELAYHFEMAGMIDRARVYYNLAGDAARETYQNTRAIVAYNKALSLTPTGELETRFMLLMSREALTDLIGDREAQKADLDALDRLLEEAAEVELPGQHAAVAGRWANFRNRTGDYPGAVAAAEQAIALANPQVMPHETVQTYSILSDGLYRQGRHAEAMDQGHAGLELAGQVGDRKGESSLLNMLGWIAYEYRGAREAREYFQRSLEIARAIGDRQIEARPLNNLGILAGTEGDYAAAQEYYEQALQISREIGSRNGEGLVLGNLGWIARKQGDYAGALNYIEQSLRLAREVGDLFQEVYVLANLSAVSFNLGDLPGAMAYAGNGLVLSRETGDRSAEAWCLIAQGNVYRRMGALTRAKEVYRQALEIRQSMEQPNLACEPLAGLAQVALEESDHEVAMESVHAILTYLEGGGTLEGAEEPIWVYWTCYLVLKETGDPRAPSILESAHTLLQSMADCIKDESLRESFLENVEANRSILNTWRELQSGDAG